MNFLEIGSFLAAVSQMSFCLFLLWKVFYFRSPLPSSPRPLQLLHDGPEELGPLPEPGVVSHVEEALDRCEPVWGLIFFKVPTSIQAGICFLLALGPLGLFPSEGAVPFVPVPLRKIRLAGGGEGGDGGGQPEENSLHRFYFKFYSASITSWLLPCPCLTAAPCPSAPAASRRAWRAW